MTGKVFRALLLDFSQYTGARRQSNIEIIEFWKGDRETLRKLVLIYDPRVALEDLQKQIEESRAKSVRAAASGDLQPELGLPGV
jgi:hypothetical protein